MESGDSVRRRMGLLRRGLAFIKCKLSFVARIHCFLRDFVAIGEDALELGTDEWSANEISECAKGEFVCDAVFDKARMVTVRDEDMGVLPAAKRARELDILKLAVFDEIAMLESPEDAKRAEANAEGAAVAIVNSAGALDDLEVFPRRRQALEGAGLCMPAEEFGGRSLDARASDELRGPS